MSLGLKVNLGKTKVVMFRKGGRIPFDTKFVYGDKSIEIVNEYAYLGVVFSYTGVFSRAAKEFNKKGKAALTSLWGPVYSGRMQSFHAKFKLFSSIAASCALYSSHIWALGTLTPLRRSSISFLKES